AQRMESVGLSVELELRGDLDTMPAGLALGVYRIVQESLTNVLRHAGPGATAKVRVHSDERQVMVEITDTGQGTGDFDEGSGNGLLGMRERVAVLGGSITVGSEPDVGWAVRAILPLNARPHDEEHLP
ncbi:MAG: sensor histidine kinase, partial [Mycobacteriaceae bacterium]